MRCIKEPICIRNNLVGHMQPLAPAFGNSFQSVVSACELADNRGSGVGIVAQIGSLQHGRLE
jgi:hypothetical protein